MFPMLNIIDQTQIGWNYFGELLSNEIDGFINTHTIKKETHEELMAMRHLESDVACINEMLNQWSWIIANECENSLINIIVLYFLKILFKLD